MKTLVTYITKTGQQATGILIERSEVNHGYGNVLDDATGEILYVQFGVIGFAK